MLGYSEAEDGTVTLKMSRDDYRFLLFSLGFAAGKDDVSPGGDNGKYWAFIDRVNRGNPRYTPYGPEESPE